MSKVSKQLGIHFLNTICGSPKPVSVIGNLATFSILSLVVDCGETLAIKIGKVYNLYVVEYSIIKYLY